MMDRINAVLDVARQFYAAGSAGFLAAVGAGWTAPPWSYWVLACIGGALGVHAASAGTARMLARRP